MNDPKVKRDITSINLEPLRQTEQSCQLILENAYDLVAMHRLTDLRCEYANPTTFKVLGYSEKDLLGISAMDFIHPDDMVKVMTFIKTNLDQGQGSGEVRYRKKDGSYVWLEVTAKLMRNENDTLIVTISRDISDRKQNEATLQKVCDELEIRIKERTAQLQTINTALQTEIRERKHIENDLRKSEEYYRTIFENTGTAAVIFDKTLLISMANSRFEVLSGYSQNELVGRSPVDFVVPEDLDIVMENYRLWKLDPDKVPQNYEIRFLDKQGNIRNLIIYVSILPHSENVLVSLMDITALHQAEAALNQKVDSQTFLVNIAKTFAGAAAEDIYNLIDNTLQRIGEMYNDDHSCIYLLSDDGFTLGITHEWCTQSNAISSHLRNLSAEAFPWWMHKLRRLENIYIPRVADLPPEAQKEKYILQAQDIQSLLIVPVVYDNSLTGFLWFASIQQEKIWSEDNITVQEIIAHIFGYSLQRRKTVLALKESESYYRAIFENTGAPTMIIEADMTISRANLEWERVFGYKKEDLEGRKLTDIISVDILDTMREYQHFHKANPATGSLQYKTLLKDSRDGLRETLLYADFIPGTRKSVVTFIDLTDFNRINRAHKAICAGNMVMMQAHNEQELLQNVCQKIVEVGGYRLVWVGYIAEDDKQTVRPVAFAGEDNGYLAQLKITLLDQKRGQGPTGTAFHTGQPAVSRDFNKDDTFRPWRKAALQRGFRSSMAIPLTADDNVFGALNIYSGETDWFDNQEQQLLLDMANNLAYAIIHLRTRIEKNKTALELTMSLEKMQRILMQAVTSLGTTLEIRDPYTAGHQRRVTHLATAIAQEMGFPEEVIEAVYVAANLHDIGKINVPSEILSKPGKITDIEFSIIKTHSQAAYEIIKDIEFSWPVAEIVLQHHERMDGSGYPRGLKGSEILMEARILVVADVVEAMASHRPYRPALGVEKALEEISQNRAILYDEVAADACLRLFREKGYELLSLPN